MAPVEIPEKNSLEQVATISDERIHALEALGYFDRAAAPNPEKQNVTKDVEGAFVGVNLYGSRHKARAFLIDMDGTVLHTWSMTSLKPPWMHMELCPNGDLFVISKSRYIAKIDWNSNVLWKRTLTAHHDLDVDSQNRVFVLTRSVEKHTFDGTDVPIMDDSLTILSSQGEVIRRKPLFPVLRGLVSKSRFEQIKQRVLEGVPTQKLILEDAPSDVTHINSIQVIDRPILKNAPAGSILMSVREINRIVLLDPDMTRVLWLWGEGELQEQHHATLLESGNIMVFDNGVERKQSRVIEVNPVTEKVEWSYTSPAFFTRLRGAAQKLPNDNVLITESDKGHAFEVTSKGKIVWEFWNPDVYASEISTRAVIYRLTRYEKAFLKEGLL